MNRITTYGVGIKELCACVPKEKVTIEDKRFSKVTGIKEKRVSSMTALYLCLHAASELNRKDVKFIVSCTQTPDYLIPFNSNIVQHRLGLPSTTGTLDIATGCTGFITGLMTAFNIAMSIRDDVLLVIGDTLSKTTGPHDPASALIFGDAAAACIVEYNPAKYDKSFFSLYSDGGKGDAILMRHSENPKIYMDGDAVLEFALNEVPKAVSDMDFNTEIAENYVFHQSNMMILNEFKRKLVPHWAAMPTSIEMYGNTSGASIPLTMALNEVKGMSLLCGYGSGLSWGVAKMDVQCEYHEIIEV